MKHEPTGYEPDAKKREAERQKEEKEQPLNPFGSGDCSRVDVPGPDRQDSSDK